jgi:hypothetical protein
MKTMVAMEKKPMTPKNIKRNASKVEPLSELLQKRQLTNSRREL